MGGLPHLPITPLTLADPLADDFTGGFCCLDVSALAVPRITGSRGGEKHFAQLMCLLRGLSTGF